MQVLTQGYENLRGEFSLQSSIQQTVLTAHTAMDRDYEPSRLTPGGGVEGVCVHTCSIKLCRVNSLHTGNFLVCFHRTKSPGFLSISFVCGKKTEGGNFTC